MSVKRSSSAFPRLQLVELTDLPSCPAFLRRCLLEYLATIIRLAKGFDPVAPILAPLVETYSPPRIVDLCAGAGGPWPSLATAVAGSAPRFQGVVLTDRHPLPAVWERITASDPSVTSFGDAVDARSVPSALPGVRTLFDGLHHFPPEQAREILGDAYRARVPILVAEGVERTIRGLIAVLLSPLFVWLVTPFVRPFSFVRLIFTYLVPIVPIAVLFDGVVSCLRAYRPDELLALVQGFDAGYEWEARSVAQGPARITVLVGRPAPARS